MEVAGRTDQMHTLVEKKVLQKQKVRKNNLELTKEKNVVRPKTVLDPFRQKIRVSNVGGDFLGKLDLPRLCLQDMGRALRLYISGGCSVSESVHPEGQRGQGLEFLPSSPSTSTVTDHRRLAADVQISSFPRFTYIMRSQSIRLLKLFRRVRVH